ncbi:MAG: hypothetical protein IPK60_24560 [Sandaracinaceae bacterium]|nr:hypothetical protein [Sandaracinaceae bacterium]
MSTSLRIAFALITLLTASACREIIDAPTDMGVAGDMPPPVDAGPCSPVCGGETPVCLVAEDGGVASCEECAIDDDCDGNDHCDPASHECVQCFDNSQCGTPELARCDLTRHTCAACDDNSQCAGFATTPACVVGEGCFECNRETRGLCNGGLDVCDATTHHCADRRVHSVERCGECVSDDDCAEDSVCAPMTFGSSSTPVGNFCLLRQSEAAGADCTTSANAPYTHPDTVLSLDGFAGSVCTLTLATCVAQNDYRVTTCTEDTDCGVEGLDDGYCNAFGTEGAMRCTTRCSVADDCSSGLACPDTHSPRICSF